MTPYYQDAVRPVGSNTNESAPGRLCDQPGCDRPATSAEHAEARNTGTKTWYSCGEHRATR